MLEKHSESEVHVDKLEQGPASSIAFGLERLGLIAVQAPIVSCIVLLALIVGAVFGIQRIKIDDSLSQLFRSNSKEFHQYEEVTKKFPAEEFDVLVVVEGKNLLARNNLEKLRDFVTDLQLVEGTRGLVSLFSARQAPAPGKLPAALFPAELPEGDAYNKFIETVKANEIIRGKLLSEDGTLALIVLSLEPDVVASSKLGSTVGDIRKLVAQDLGDTGLNVELSGEDPVQLGHIIVASGARVALGDEIGAILDARMVLMLIGERPGLSAPDSLGAYLTFAPKPGRTDAERNCVSNIHRAGLSYDEAAFKIAWLVREGLARETSGVALKDESGDRAPRRIGTVSAQ